MAEQQTHYEFVEVKSQDIMAERQRMWNGFGIATRWTIGLTIGLLVALYLIWG